MDILGLMNRGNVLKSIGSKCSGPCVGSRHWKKNSLWVIAWNVWEHFVFFVCCSLPDLIYFDALNKQNKKWGKEEAQKREGLFLVISWMMIGCRRKSDELWSPVSFHRIFQFFVCLNLFIFFKNHRDVELIEEESFFFRMRSCLFSRFLGKEHISLQLWKKK